MFTDVKFEDERLFLKKNLFRVISLGEGDRPDRLPPPLGPSLAWLSKFHPRTKLTALLVTIMGSRNQKKYSEFGNLTF
jgi:hypothetical protein